VVGGFGYGNASAPNLANTLYLWASNKNVAIAPTNTAGTGLYLLTNGNVGIGTTAASEPLQVNGNIAAKTGQIYSAAQASAAASPLTFNANAGNVLVWTTNTAAPTANIINMKAGGIYTLVVAGSGTGPVTIACADSTSANLPPSYTPANGSRTAGTLNKSVYTIISDGANCLIAWLTGL
jgi:hypothetical protein